MRIIISVCIWMMATSLLAQQEKHLENVKGEWVLSNDITPIEAQEKAITQAKVEALRLAGVPEFVSESNVMYKTEGREEMNEFFESLVSVDVSGEVSDFDIEKKKRGLTAMGM